MQSSKDKASLNIQTLKEAIIEAYSEPSDGNKTNQVHRLLLTSTLLLPINKALSNSNDDVVPLFLEENERCFLPVFTQKEHLESWAQESIDEISTLSLLGSELIKGVSDSVYVCLDIGCAHYKEFSPQEVARMRQMLSKVESLMKKNTKTTDRVSS